MCGYSYIYAPTALPATSGYQDRSLEVEPVLTQLPQMPATTAGRRAGRHTTYPLGVCVDSDTLSAMAIRAQRRGGLALLALLFGIAVVLPTMLHCVPGDKHAGPPAAHHVGLAARNAADSPTPDPGATADHSHADSAVRTALCQGVDGLTAALRGDNELRALAAFVAAMVVTPLAVPLFFGISRGPPLPVRRAAIPRSGRVLLTDLCIIRR